MAIQQYAPLEPIDLDPRNEEELIDRAADRIYTASGGTINDFSENSPAIALVEGQALAGAELLYQANQFAEAVTIQFLQIAGIQRSLGTVAEVVLTFTLTQRLSTPFTLPAGYIVKANDRTGRKLYATTETLIIPAGAESGRVAAESMEVGAFFNTPAFTITGLSQPYAYLRSVTNEQRASGGSNEESLEQVKTRAFAAIRRRGLISGDDYEARTRELLGIGGVAKAIGNLASDRISYEKGVVHVFALNGDLTLPAQAQINEIQARLQAETVVGVFVYVSPVELYPIDALVIAKLMAGVNPETIASDMFAQLRDYLAPGSLPLGETVVLKTAEYQIQLAGVGGIDYLQSCTLNGLSTNVPLPHDYTAAYLKSLLIQFMTPTGELLQYQFGEGDPD